MLFLSYSAQTKKVVTEGLFILLKPQIAWSMIAIYKKNAHTTKGANGFSARLMVIRPHALLLLAFLKVVNESNVEGFPHNSIFIKMDC